MAKKPRDNQSFVVNIEKLLKEVEKNRDGGVVHPGLTTKHIDAQSIGMLRKLLERGIRSVTVVTEPFQ